MAGSSDTLPLVVADDARAVDRGPLSMFERFLVDPNVDPDKLERFMAVQERIAARLAETDYNAAMTKAQSEMTMVATDSYNPQTRSRYASYEALDAALRPIYTKHGFGLSFDTEPAGPDQVTILCDVTHSGGHSARKKITMPADGKGAKGGDVMTRTHAIGSGVSYGMRYLLKMIFNIAVGDADDDGNESGGVAATPEQPNGYADWLLDLEVTAQNGTAALEAAWKASAKERREFAATNDSKRWNAIKAKAATVKR